MPVSLPPQQAGTCTIALLNAYAFWSKYLIFNFQCTHYRVPSNHGVFKPSVTGQTKFHNFVHGLFPNLGFTVLEQPIVSISTTLEITQNATVGPLKNLQTEIHFLSQLAIQIIGP